MFNSKIKHHTTTKQLLAFFGLCLLVVMSRVHPLLAQAVTQGYNTDDNLQRGMIVRLKKDDPNKVEALANSSTEKMQGVVVSPNDAPFTVSSANQKVFVSSNGRYQVLVSDQNGGIQIGDYVTISALAGIGMKAGSTEPLILGKALAVFNGKDNVLSTAKYKDGKNKEQPVNIGLTVVDITISRNPNLKLEASVPGFLKKASKAVTSKDVGANRIYIGVVLLAVTAVVAGVVLYAGVRSSIIALGRNPLSRKTIIRGMIQVVVVSLIIFLVGLFGVYLLLKL